MLNLEKLKKQELIKELKKIARKDKEIQSKIDERNQRIRELRQKEQRLVKKYKYVGNRRKQIFIAKVCGIVCSILIYIVTSLIAIGSFILFFTTHRGSEALVSAVLFVVSAIFFIHAGNIRYYIQFTPRRRWEKFERTILPDLILKDDGIQAIYREIGGIEWEIPFIKKQFLQIRKKNNLAKRYYGYENILANMLINNRADTLKEAIQELEKDWKHREIKGQIAQEMRRAFRQNQQLQKQLREQQSEINRVNRRVQANEWDISSLETELSRRR